MAVVYVLAAPYIMAAIAFIGLFAWFASDPSIWTRKTGFIEKAMILVGTAFMASAYLFASAFLIG
jgi:nitrate reductase gamma subunit